MNILFVTPEFYPVVKTGGLGDVSAALSDAFVRLGHRVRLLMPGYPKAMALKNKRLVAYLPPFFGEENIKLYHAKVPGNEASIWLIDCPNLYRREGGPYQDPDGHDWPDNDLRFGLLAHVAKLIASPENPTKFVPHVVHCHDWQAALAPALIAFSSNKTALTVTTIHNLGYLGLFPAEQLSVLGIPPEAFQMHGLEFFGKISFLKAGLYYSDVLTTVSPTYAAQIQSEEYGCGLHGLLQARANRLFGILNGIDTNIWNPKTDAHLVKTYDVDSLNDKKENKKALLKAFGLPEDDYPLFGFVGRLTWQKGVDILLDAIPELADQKLHLVLLGNGDQKLEQQAIQVMQAHPEIFSVKIGFIEELAHLIEGGADMFLMPSRYEPCGLNQMYSMRYGTPPLVRKTGGLADTVIDTTEETLVNGTATGLVFEDSDKDTLALTIQRAIALYTDKPSFRKVQENGMRKDFSWEKSAQTYIDVFKKLLA